jgi:hypothetical protein
MNFNNYIPTNTLMSFKYETPILNEIKLLYLEYINTYKVKPTFYQITQSNYKHLRIEIENLKKTDNGISYLKNINVRIDKEDIYILNLIPAVYRIQVYPSNTSIIVSETPF